jgi:hypothetical protein
MFIKQKIKLAISRNDKKEINLNYKKVKFIN